MAFFIDGIHIVTGCACVHSDQYQVVCEAPLIFDQPHKPGTDIRDISVTGGDILVLQAIKKQKLTQWAKEIKKQKKVSDSEAVTEMLVRGKRRIKIKLFQLKEDYTLLKTVWENS